MKIRVRVRVSVLIFLCFLKYVFGSYLCSAQIKETLFAFVGSQVEFGCGSSDKKPFSKCVLIQNSTNKDRINVQVNSVNILEILHPRITFVGNLNIGKCRFQLRNISIEDSISWNLLIENEIIKTFKINVSKNDAGCYAQSLRLGGVNEDTNRILTQEPMDCQNICMTSGQCNFWTWSHPNESGQIGINCQFFNNTIKPADKPDHTAISGSKFCPGCWRFGKGVKIGNNTDGDPVTANSIKECHHICEGRNNCSLFYWNGNQCIIFKNLFVEDDEIIPEMNSIIGHSNCLSPSPDWPQSIFINRTSETKTLMFSIVGVILCLIGVSCICILILYKRNKNKNRKMKTKPKKEPNVEELELQDKSNWRVTETHNPIPIGDFVEGVKSQRFPGDTEFAKLNEVDARIIGFRETSLIGRKYTSSSEDSSLNRYGNILPYDSNRVKLLKQINGTDYINASWIQNRNLIGDMPVFIATQGPLENTTEHFLQMVIENNVKAIVMLTDLEDEVENGVGELTTIEKCARYWPESGTKEEIFGHVKVKVGETSGIPNIENAFRRSFVLEDVTTNKRFGPVVHYQFIDWPDFGVAHSTKPVVELAKTLQDYLHERPSKVIVHCSAGVGRTGSFIALYKLMFKIDTGEINNFIDIYNEVYQLREDRCKLIQKSEQYQFLHECVASYYKEKTNPSKINDADYIYTTFLASEDENK